MTRITYLTNVMLLLICSVLLSACGSTTQSYQYASWDSMEYYDANAVAPEGGGI